MKTRFLDVRNCHALLPQRHGLSLVQHLEDCLREINDRNGPLKGAIDRLIKHNEKTRIRFRGSQRFLDSSIEVSQAAYIAARLINTQAMEGPIKGPAKFHTNIVSEDGTYWKTIIPLQFLLKGWGDANDGHQCYVHTKAGDSMRTMLGYRSQSTFRLALERTGYKCLPEAKSKSSGEASAS